MTQSSQPRANWQAERDSAALYEALARAARDPEQRRAYRELAATEHRHAQYWAGRLQSEGQPPLGYRTSWGTQLLIMLVRLFGARFVLPSVTARELRDRDHYAGLAEPVASSLASDEQGHAAMLRGWTDGSLGGRLRAAVLGANDGLASNLCLLMGVSGGGASRRTILLAGVAGLIGGACSMALGEWLSVTNARELAASQLDREIGAPAPSGSSGALAVLGSAEGAAAASFCLFGLGALVPLAPFALLTPVTGALTSCGFSLVALFGLGVATSLFNSRTALYSGARQTVIGAAAAGVTFAAGWAFSFVSGRL